MRILGLDYIKDEERLTICITDNINGIISLVHIEQIEGVTSLKQAEKLCKQFSKRFNCDKILEIDIK